MDPTMEAGTGPASGAKPALGPVVQIDDVRTQAHLDEVVRATVFTRRIAAYAVALSDHLWIGGYRVHTPESVQAGNYRPHVSPSIYTCAASQFAHVPDARDFNLEAILEERGGLCSN